MVQKRKLTSAMFGNILSMRTCSEHTPSPGFALPVLRVHELFYTYLGPGSRSAKPCGSFLRTSFWQRLCLLSSIAHWVPPGTNRVCRVTQICPFEGPAYLGWAGFGWARTQPT
eukprot:875812-Pelagomonas_calceolata.AAC.1